MFNRILLGKKLPKYADEAFYPTNTPPKKAVIGTHNSSAVFCEYLCSANARLSVKSLRKMSNEWRFGVYVKALGVSGSVLGYGMVREYDRMVVRWLVDECRARISVDREGVVERDVFKIYKCVMEEYHRRNDGKDRKDRSDGREGGKDRSNAKDRSDGKEGGKDKKDRRDGREDKKDRSNAKEDWKDRRDSKEGGKDRNDGKSKKDKNKEESKSNEESKNDRNNTSPKKGEQNDENQSNRYNTLIKNAKDDDHYNNEDALSLLPNTLFHKPLITLITKLLDLPNSTPPLTLSLINCIVLDLKLLSYQHQKYITQENYNVFIKELIRTDDALFKYLDVLITHKMNSCTLSNVIAREGMDMVRYVKYHLLDKEINNEVVSVSEKVNVKEEYFDFLVVENQMIEAQVHMRETFLEEIKGLKRENARLKREIERMKGDEHR